MIGRLFAPVKPIWDLVCLEFNRAALRQINPLHPDVPRIVLRVHELEQRRST